MLSPKFSLSPSFSWVSPPIWEDHCYWQNLTYWGPGGKVILLDFQIHLKTLVCHNSQNTWFDWWTDFTGFETDLACAFFAFITLSSDRLMFRHFGLIVLATENASFISATWAFGSECKCQLTLSLELECHKATNESSSHADIQPSLKVRLAR